jgi:hypothetical protein
VPVLHKNCHLYKQGQNEITVSSNIITHPEVEILLPAQGGGRAFFTVKQEATTTLHSNVY